MLEEEVSTEQPRKTDPCGEKSCPLCVDAVTFYSTYPANIRKAAMGKPWGDLQVIANSYSPDGSLTHTQLPQKATSYLTLA